MNQNSALRSTYKRLGRSRLIGGRILDALDGGGGGEGRLADGLLGGDAKGVGSGKECNNGKGGEAHDGQYTWGGMLGSGKQVRTGGTTGGRVGEVRRSRSCLRADIIERIQKLHHPKFPNTPIPQSLSGIWSFSIAIGASYPDDDFILLRLVISVAPAVALA